MLMIHDDFYSFHLMGLKRWLDHQHYRDSSRDSMELSHIKPIIPHVLNPRIYIYIYVHIKYTYIYNIHIV